MPPFQFLRNPGFEISPGTDWPDKDVTSSPALVISGVFTAFLFVPAGIFPLGIPLTQVVGTSLKPANSYELTALMYTISLGGGPPSPLADLRLTGQFSPTGGEPWTSFGTQLLGIEQPNTAATAVRRSLGAFEVPPLIATPTQLAVRFLATSTTGIDFPFWFLDDCELFRVDNPATYPETGQRPSPPRGERWFADPITHAYVPESHAAVDPFEPAADPRRIRNVYDVDAPDADALAARYPAPPRAEEELPDP